MMNRQQVYSRMLSFLKFPATPGQDEFLQRFSAFATDPDAGIFVLKGYAGTGKTTMVSVLTAAFSNIVLLAPTGRAAKVIAGYTGRPAYTIHKLLYMPALTSDGRMMLRLADNVFRKTLFIVDEASMIPDAAAGEDGGTFPGVNLLQDLMRYVFSGAACRLMLVGDLAQLPPVHFEDSPALDPSRLALNYRRKVIVAELTDVVRQQEEGGILLNATAIRKLIVEKDAPRVLHIQTGTDVVRMHASELPETLHSLYQAYGEENVMVITRSNRGANQYNRMIRFQTLWMEDEVGGGDRLMIVKNNYHWLPRDHPAGFLANGDIVSVKKISRFEECHGRRFARAVLTVPDFPDQPEFEVMLLLDTLMSESPSLSGKEQQNLFDRLQAAYEEEEPDRRRRNALIKKDPYYNALQVKFAYAITCHKAQGGQWPVVFVDQGYLTEEMMDKPYYRWLYTAVTRASEKLYLLNFDERFFGGDSVRK